MSRGGGRGGRRNVATRPDRARPRGHRGPAGRDHCQPRYYVLVEAKRIRRSSLQAHQLPRELTALMQQAGNRSPLMLLILGAPPPVAVAGRGRLPLRDALLDNIGDVREDTRGRLDSGCLGRAPPRGRGLDHLGRNRDVGAASSRSIPIRSRRSRGHRPAPHRRSHPSNRMAQLNRATVVRTCGEEAVEPCPVPSVVAARNRRTPPTLGAGGVSGDAAQVT